MRGFSINDACDLGDGPESRKQPFETGTIRYRLPTRQTHRHMKAFCSSLLVISSHSNSQHQCFRSSADASHGLSSVHSFPLLHQVPPAFQSVIIQFAFVSTSPKLKLQPPKVATMAFASLKKIALLAAACAVVTVSAASPEAPYYNQEGILQIGTQEALNITVAAGHSRDDIVAYPDASYVAVHFSNFNLPEGDLVVVRSPDSEVAHFYTGKGRDDQVDFIASFIPGDTAIVQYFSASEGSVSDAPSYTISGFSRGFPARTVSESICGVDNTKPAKCFQSGSTLYSSLPSAYTKGRAVARLLIGGSSLCTGWLVGSAGHLITNQHCITTAAAAKTIDIEFGAESGSCATECKTQLGCAGTVVATTSTFVTSSTTYDYAIVKLPTSAAVSSYGYLQLRAAGPKLNERIYIPQHPSGWAKRVAYIVDSGASSTITSLAGSTSCGSNEVGYNADTAGGASGSPVLSATDNLVVALHHCGGCQNTAVNVLDIIKDLKAKAITITNLSA